MDIGDIGLPLIGGGILVFGLLSGGDNPLAGGGGGAQIKALRDNVAVENVLSQTKNVAASQRSDIALQRYQQGCIVHVRQSAVQRPEDVAIGGVTVDYLPVREGDVLRAMPDGNAYSEGTIVCDAWGNTAVIGPDGAATDGAFTGENVMPFIEAYFSGRWGGGAQ